MNFVKFEWKYPFVMKYSNEWYNAIKIDGADEFYRSKESKIHFPDRRTAIFNGYLNDGIAIKFARYSDIVRTSYYYQDLIKRGLNVSNINVNDLVNELYILLLTVIKIDDVDFIIATKRSDKVLTYNSCYQFIPSGGIDSHFDYEIPTILGTMQHELAEELFGVGEFDAIPELIFNITDEHSVTFIGDCVEFGTHGLCFKLQIPDEYSMCVIKSLKESWEGKPILLNVSSLFDRYDKDKFVPSSYFAFKEIFRQYI